MGYYDNPAQQGRANGDWNIKNGVEIGQDVRCAVIDATAMACAMHASRHGRGPSFEDVKKIVSAARFGASCAENQIEWVNGKVRESNDFDRGRGQHAPSRNHQQQSHGRDYDDEIGF